MKTKARIAIEILGPGFLGTVLFLVWKRDQFTPLSAFSFRVFGGYLAAAYAFVLLPSLGYSYLMERWLKHHAPGARAFAGTTAVSTIIGFAAGVAVQLASEAPVIFIGTTVGLLLGGILAFSAPSEKRA